MRTAKPILLWSTLIGVLVGLLEAYRLAGGLVFLMATVFSLMGCAMAILVRTIRREQAEIELAAAPGGRK